MRKTTLLFIALFLTLALLLAACGGGTTEPAANETAAEPTSDAAAEADCASADVFCVGLVTDVGEIDDKSFNQSAWEGVQKAGTDLGAKVEYIETGDAKDYATNIELFANNSYDVIVTVGFALTEATAQAAATYP